MEIALLSCTLPSASPEGPIRGRSVWFVRRKMPDLTIPGVWIMANSLLPLADKLLSLASLAMSQHACIPLQTLFVRGFPIFPFRLRGVVLLYFQSFVPFRCQTQDSSQAKLLDCLTVFLSPLLLRNLYM